MPSLQTPWWHGGGLQSSMFSSQRRPAKPWEDISRYGKYWRDSIVEKVTISNAYDFSSPSAHSQSYPLGRSIHLAPFKQGVLEHSSMSIWQVSPLKPKHITLECTNETF